MYRNIPTYLPGDVVRLKLEFQHETNLADVWATFEKEEEVATLTHFRFTASLRHPEDLRQLNRDGFRRISEVCLEASVFKDRPLTGNYELIGVFGLPFGEDRNEKNVLEFKIPEGVRFRVTAPPNDDVPSITSWQLKDPAPPTFDIEA